MMEARKLVEVDLTELTCYAKKEPDLHLFGWMIVIIRRRIDPSNLQNSEIWDDSKLSLIGLKYSYYGTSTLVFSLRSVGDTL